MKLSGNVITLAVGGIILIAATWYASRLPASPIPSVMLTGAPTTTTPAQVPLTPTVPTPPVAGGSKPAAALADAKPSTPSIVFSSPSENALWLIGVEHTISWDKAGASVGRIALINAATGAIAGWVSENVASVQTSLSWNTRDLFITRTSPLKKDVIPGNYFLKIFFVSPNTLPIVSSPFFIETSS